MCAVHVCVVQCVACLLQGVLIALDKNTNKTRRVQEACAQHNLCSVRVYAFDASKAVSEADGLNLDGKIVLCEMKLRLVI